MRVLIAADHAGVELKQYLVEYLIKDGEVDVHIHLHITDLFSWDLHAFLTSDLISITITINIHSPIYSLRQRHILIDG